MAGGLRHRGGKKRRLMGEINVTPFVDVTLVLLIIFMVAAPLLTVGVPVDLPKTEAKAMQNENEPISITVMSDGKIFIQNSQTDFDQILPQLSALTANSFDRRIYIRADGKSAYENVMQVMARINSAGYRNLGLVTDPLGSGQTNK